MTTKVKITNDMPADSGNHTVVVTGTSSGEHIIKPGENYETHVYDGNSLSVKEGPKTHTGPGTHS